VVIDNVSSDGSCEVIEKQFPSVTLIRSKKHLGITDSRNIGVDWALSNSADYILFLDNDTIVQEDMLTELVSGLEQDDRIAVTTAKIYFYSDRDRIWALGGTINFYKGNISLIGYDEIDHGQYDSCSTFEVDHVIGCCLMIRSKVIKKIGKLDPHFYYGEDTEFCIRAKRAGYKVVVNPRAVMWHKESKIWKDRDLNYIRTKEIIWLMRKHAKFHHWSLFCFYALFTLSKIALSEGIRGNFKEILPRIKGAFDGLQK
jgi:hypothetical protein